MGRKRDHDDARADGECDYLARCSKRQLARTAAVNASVCRLKVQGEEVNVLEPYRDRQTQSGVGTGFVMSVAGEHYVVTAMHVVDGARSVHAIFSTFYAAKPIRLTVLGGNPVLDVALLGLHEEASSDGVSLRSVPPIPVGEAGSDGLMETETVSAAGFALGEKHLQLSTGVLSARKVGPVRLQVDLAVAPGNSGGPLFRQTTGSLVGIVTSGHVMMQGINYAAPIVESMTVFRRVVEAQILPHFEFGVDFDAHFCLANAALLTPSLRRLLPEGGVGGTLVVCTCAEMGIGAVDDHQLRAGDLLHAVTYSEGSFHVDLQSRIAVPWTAQPIPFEGVLDRLRCDVQDGELVSEPVTAHVIRDAESLRIKLRLRRPRAQLRKLYPYAEPVSFVNRGGVVVQLLSENISEATRRKRGSFMESPWLDAHSVLVVTHVSASSPFVQDEVLQVGDFVCMVNNESIAPASANALQRYATAFAGAAERLDATVTIRVRDGRMSTATVADVLAYEALPNEATRVSAPGRVAVVSFEDGVRDTAASLLRSDDEPRVVADRGGGDRVDVA